MLAFIYLFIYKPAVFEYITLFFLMLLNHASEKFSMYTIISKNHSYSSYGYNEYPWKCDIF